MFPNPHIGAMFFFFFRSIGNLFHLCAEKYLKGAFVLNSGLQYLT